MAVLADQGAREPGQESRKGVSVVSCHHTRTGLYCSMTHNSNYLFAKGGLVGGRGFFSLAMPKEATTGTKRAGESRVSWTGANPFSCFMQAWRTLVGRLARPHDKGEDPVVRTVE